MRDADYLPEGYRWATSHETHQYLIQGLTMDVIPIWDSPYTDVAQFVGWAIKA